MTTAQVAQYLGLTGRRRLSYARAWLARRGIGAVSRLPGHRGQNLYPQALVATATPRRASRATLRAVLAPAQRRTRPVYNRWRDAEGTPVAVGARVEQTGVDTRMGALRRRLHQLGEVTSRGATCLRVRFDEVGAGGTAVDIAPSGGW